MRTARTTMVFAAVLALPYLVVGLLAGGPRAQRLLVGGAVVLAVAASAAAWMTWRGRRVDDPQDERQVFITGNAMRFSFWVMAVAVQAYWAWEFARFGNEGDRSFWLLVVLWVSFAVGYVYNLARH